MVGPVSAKGLGWQRIAAAVLIMLSAAVVARAQSAATNTGQLNEPAGNSKIESASNLKSGDKPASATNLTFLLAAGAVCDSSEGGGCPAILKSKNGDGYRLSGAGTFSSRGAVVVGAGAFTHETSLGVALESGVWVTEELVSFDSYGLGPSPILKDPKVIGSARLGPRRMPGPMQPVAAGGRAIFRVRLLPIVGPPRTATLEINCAVGQPPAEHQVDGIKLVFDGRELQYEEQGPSHSLFLVGPTVTSSAKTD
jgi:hypothetical protein